MFYFFCLTSFLSFGQETSLVKNVFFKSIGPSVMSGRVTCLAVNPKNNTEFYVGYASGGVWHTTNNGTSFKPILDSSPTQNVGCIAVDWNTHTIWVGTGEVNASRSSYAGIGILKSSDNGKTWQNMGLNDSHHISKIIINPKNSNELVVAVIGHLYSKNEERGVFKTIDGGKTWQKTLFINTQTGIIDLAADPTNFNIIYASSWDKDRKAWNFRGNGKKSAIYKSTDAGSTFKKITTEESGFPTGSGIGRIGLAVFNKDIIYAIVDNQNRRKEDSLKPNKKGLTKNKFKTMSNAQFLALDDSQLNQFLKNNNFQKKYTSEKVKQLIKKGKVKPVDLALYLEDANTKLFDTPVIGAQVYKSINGGTTWQKTHEGFLDDVYYSYGYYFGRIHVSPKDPNKIYIYGVPILTSNNSGKTFTSINGDNVHADFHDLWIDSTNPNHLIVGNDGGVNISYDDGKNWIKCNTPSVGQFYSINVDFEKPYHVYGGLQDNGVWKGNHNHTENTRWHQTGNYEFKSILGSDGMQAQIDKRNSNIVYTGFQFGNYFKLNLETNQKTYIKPKHEIGETPYRFNWQTPILLSSHNQDILYLGGNKLMRSINQGKDWEAISKDLTQGYKKGNVAYGTITTISESPFQLGLLYTGSDDGLIYVSKNSGKDWHHIAVSLPKDLWISRVIASKHKKERVYATLNGYRKDDFKPYVFVSENYGTTWQNISGNLPSSPVNVIKEDSENENLLYLGTDQGVFVSFNKGKSWEEFSKGIPKVAVHDLAIQPEAKDLVVGTHGRSLYVANISLLQKMSKDQINTTLISDIEPIDYSAHWGSKFSMWSEVFEPNINISYYSPKTENSTILIKNSDGKELQNLSQASEKGINVFNYNGSLSEKGKKVFENHSIKKAKNGTYYLPVGTYTLQINNTSTHFDVK